MDIQKFEKSKYKSQIQSVATLAHQMRTDEKDPIDMEFDDAVKAKFNISLDELLVDLGIDRNVDSLQAIHTVGDMDVRWLIPEIIRSAIRLGLRTAPIWPSITAQEVNTSQKKVTIPWLNMSDAAPRKVNEAETISVGAISYGEKSVEVFKIGRGIKIPYEVVQFVSIDVIAIFLQDFGVKLGHALDTLAIDVLMNGDQEDGSSAAAVIGVETPGAKTYRDFLKPWIRGARMGRNFSTIIGGEDAALDTLDLPEFKNRQQGTTEANLTLRTPVPRDAEYFVHGNVPAGQEILVDKRYALLKMNVVGLLVESEKIVSNQTIETYVSLTTGFAKMFLDSTLILDSDVQFDGFPAYMDIDSLLNVDIK